MHETALYCPALHDAALKETKLHCKALHFLTEMHHIVYIAYHYLAELAQYCKVVNVFSALNGRPVMDLLEQLMCSGSGG